MKDSDLVTMADEARRPTRWWLAWLIAIVIIVGAGAIGSVVGSAVLGSPEPADVRYQYVELFIFGFTLLGLFLWVRLKEGRALSSVGFRGSGRWRKFVVGWLVGGAWMALGVLFTAATGQFGTHASTHTVSGGSAVLAVLPLVLVFVLQGSTEEAVTRGYMLQTGARGLPGWLAIVGSSVVFAVAHVDFHPLVLLNLVLYALFASLVAIEQGSLWLIAGFHAGWNLFQSNVFGLPNSGNSAAVSLFEFGPAPGSSAWITGGDFGLEGGVVGTFLFGAAAVLAFVRLRRATAAPRHTVSA